MPDSDTNLTPQQSNALNYVYHINAQAAQLLSHLVERRIIVNASTNPEILISAEKEYAYNLAMLLQVVSGQENHVKAGDLVHDINVMMHDYPEAVKSYLDKLTNWEKTILAERDSSVSGRIL